MPRRPRPPIRLRAAVALLALAGPAVAAGAVTAPVTAPAPTPAAANDRLRCVGPTDAAAIDAVLTEAGSPLAGRGAVFVRAGVAADIDPRALVAIAAHETMLMTYGPAAAINNPFGLGPHLRYRTSADAIRFAARLLDRWYVGEGRSTIPLIASKWAPVGALNDPRGLNAHWTAGVSRYYAALGGDPLRPVLLSVQAPLALCAPDTVVARGAPAAGRGRPVVVMWAGATPAARGPAAAEGGDPQSGLPAAIAPFAFPVAVPPGGEVRYGPARAARDGLLTVTLATAPDAHVVAATDGRLQAASLPERAAGVAFWVVRADGDRVGYGPLAGYADGVRHGAAVRAGAPLGRSVGTVAVAWTRGGTPIDPHPLLTATRPSDPPPRSP